MPKGFCDPATAAAHATLWRNYSAAADADKRGSSTFTPILSLSPSFVISYLRAIHPEKLVLGVMTSQFSAVYIAVTFISSSPSLLQLCFCPGSTGKVTASAPLWVGGGGAEPPASAAVRDVQGREGSCKERCPVQSGVRGPVMSGMITFFYAVNWSAGAWFHDYLVKPISLGTLEQEEELGAPQSLAHQLPRFVAMALYGRHVVEKLCLCFSTQRSC